MPNDSKYDERKEYLVKVLSRTRRKDYENYVVNAVWQRLGDPTLKPETQRYVRRDNGYALIDLYFPAVNVGVECDEAYHLDPAQASRDRLREEEISARLAAVDGTDGYIACHVDASGSFEDMERGIEKAVRVIRERRDKLKPEPWNPAVALWEVALRRGRIAVGDGLAFRTIADAYRCFGRNPARMQRCYFSLGDGVHNLWCPQLAIQMPDGTRVAAAAGWTNVLSYDGKALYESSDQWAAGKPGGPLRITFAKARDELGRRAYRFVGVFECLGADADDSHTTVYRRVAAEVDLGARG